MSDDEIKEMLKNPTEIDDVESEADFNTIAKKLFKHIQFILDGSDTGLGKTHRSANTKPEDFDVEYVRFVTTNTLNLSRDLATWDVAKARHGGTTYAKSGHKRRTRHNEKIKHESSTCHRAGLMQHFQDKNVPIPVESFEDEDGNKKFRTVLCRGCDNLPNCQLLRDKYNNFKNEMCVIHPEQLCHSEEPQKGFYHPSKALGAFDEIGSMSLIESKAYSLESFERAFQDLQIKIRELKLPLMPWEVHDFLIDLLIYLRNADMPIYGNQSGNEFFASARKLADYDFEKLKEQLDDYAKIISEIPDL